MFKHLLLIATAIILLNVGIVYAATTDVPNNKQTDKTKSEQKKPADTKTKPITDADTEDYDNPAYY